MKFLNSSKLKVYELFPPLWRHESDLALVNALAALALALWVALLMHSISGIQHHTSGIKTDQSEQATLSLPLRICQSTCSISDFRGPQLAETLRESG